MSTTLQNIPLKRIDGSPATLNDYRGKVLLIVNVASKCGLTPQYEGLEKLYKSYREKGLEILAFPANNFLAQEPGTNEEILSFCKSTYDVSFPLFQKISVKGSDQHPLYAELTKAQPQAEANPGGSLEQRLTEKGLGRTQASDVLWNFEKFIVNREGVAVDRFAPDVAPDSTLLTHRLEELLNA